MTKSAGVFVAAILASALTQVKISVHVRIRECGHVFAIVLDFKVELLEALDGFRLGFFGAKLHLLHLLLDHAQVIVSLSALLLFFFGLTGDGRLRGHLLLWLTRFHIKWLC